MDLKWERFSRVRSILLDFVFLFIIILFFFLSLINRVGSLSDKPLVDPAGILQVKPWMDFNSYELRRGYFPLWNPFSGFGEPHFSNIQTQLFYPLNFIYYFFQDDYGYHTYLFLKLYLSSLFIYLFLRRYHLSRISLVSSSLIYPLAGYGLWFMQLIDLNSQLLFPAFLLSLDLVWRKRDFSGFFVLVVVGMLIIFGGHPEAVFNCFFLGAFFLIFKLIIERGEKASFFATGFAVIFAILGSSVVLVPFSNYFFRSWTMHQPGFGFFHLDIKTFANLLFPGQAIFSRGPTEISVEILEQGLFGVFSSGYIETTVPGAIPGVGVVVFFLVIVSFFSLRRFPFIASFFALFLIIFLGLSYGIAPFRWLSFFPPFNVFSNFKFYFSEVHLSLAILSGFGMDRFAKRNYEKLILASALLFNFYINMLGIKPYIILGTEGLKGSDFIRELGNHLGKDSSRFSGLDGYFPANVSMSYGFYDVRSSDAIFYKRYLNLINMINKQTPEESIRYFYPSYYTQISEGEFDSPLVSLFGIKYVLGRHWLETDSIIEDVLIHGSFLGIFKPKKILLQRETEDVPLLFLHPPAKIIYHLSTKSGRLEFFPWIAREAKESDGGIFQLIAETPEELRLVYSRFFFPKDTLREFSWMGEEVDNYKRLYFITLPGAKGDFISDWMGFANLRIIDEEESGWQRLAKIRDQNDKFVYISENKNVFPEAFVVFEKEEFKTKSELLKRLEKADEDGLRRVGFFVGRVHSLKGYGKATVKIKSSKASEFKIKIEADAPCFLIWNEIYYPGWRAFIDGKETRIYEVDGGLNSVFIEEGSKELTFRFVPFDFRIGLYFSISFVFSLIIGMVFRKKNR